jgi:PAS domain-containing protein
LTSNASLTKSGAIIDVSLSVSAIKDKTGTIVGVSGIGRDVTAQRQAQYALREEVMAREQAESELRRSEERMRIAMKAAEIGFWDLDVIDVIKDEHVWSNTCKALPGVAPDSPANYQSLMNAVHPDDWKIMQSGRQIAGQQSRPARPSTSERQASVTRDV